MHSDRHNQHSYWLGMIQYSNLLKLTKISNSDLVNINKTKQNKTTILNDKRMLLLKQLSQRSYILKHLRQPITSSE